MPEEKSGAAARIAAEYPKVIEAVSSTEAFALRELAKGKDFACTLVFYGPTDGASHILIPLMAGIKNFSDLGLAVRATANGLNAWAVATVVGGRAFLGSEEMDVHAAWQAVEAGLDPEALPGGVIRTVGTMLDFRDGPWVHSMVKVDLVRDADGKAVTASLTSLGSASSDDENAVVDGAFFNLGGWR